MSEGQRLTLLCVFVCWVLQDMSLGVPAVQFVTREEDEFSAAGMDGAVATHALLPPQHHRVGMNAAEIEQAQVKEAEAKRAMQQQQAEQQQQGEEAATQPSGNGSDTQQETAMDSSD